MLDPQSQKTPGILELGVSEKVLQKPIEYTFLKDKDVLLDRWINYTVTSERVRNSPVDVHNFTDRDRAVHVARILEDTPHSVRAILRDHDHAIMGEFPRQIIQLFRETQQRELAPSVQRAQIVITKSSVRFVNEAQLRDQFHAGYVNALRYRGDQLKRRRGMFANKYAVLVVQDFNYYRREETWEQTFLRPFVYDTDLYQDAYCKQAIVESRGGEGDSDDELQVIGVSPRTGDQLRKLGFSTGKIEMSS